jgi:L-asparagine transporter-like permease
MQMPQMPDLSSLSNGGNKVDPNSKIHMDLSKATHSTTWEVITYGAIGLSFAVLTHSFPVLQQLKMLVYLVVWFIIMFWKNPNVMQNAKFRMPLGVGFIAFCEIFIAIVAAI